jgi:hypothetical protein
MLSPVGTSPPTPAIAFALPGSVPGQSHTTSIASAVAGSTSIGVPMLSTSGPGVVPTVIATPGLGLPAVAPASGPAPVAVRPAVVAAAGSGSSSAVSCMESESPQHTGSSSQAANGQQGSEGQARPAGGAPGQAAGPSGLPPRHPTSPPPPAGGAPGSSQASPSASPGPAGQQGAPGAGKAATGVPAMGLPNPAAVPLMLGAQKAASIAAIAAAAGQNPLSIAAAYNQAIAAAFSNPHAIHQLAASMPNFGTGPFSVPAAAYAMLSNAAQAGAKTTVSAASANTVPPAAAILPGLALSGAASDRTPMHRNTSWSGPEPGALIGGLPALTSMAYPMAPSPQASLGTSPAAHSSR